ncbi:MAG: DUF6036 family nucleotidyltransferase [Betaproteobacteria bacterium]
MQAYLDSHGERYCLIGGLALARWGQVRATQDADLTLLCPLGDEPAAVERLLGAFRSRVADARSFALRHRVVLLQSAAGVGIDVALGALPFEERCVQRSSEWPLAAGTALRTCGAEDLVVLKAFAGRPQDWLDIESVIVRQRGSLDWGLVQRELQPLLELREAPAHLDRLAQLRAAIEKP